MANATQTFTNEQYLEFDPFSGDEGELSCRNKAIVKARKEHPCFGGLGSDGDGHTIKVGELHKYETALVDGDYWGKYRICFSCLNKWIADLMGDEE